MASLTQKTERVREAVGYLRQKGFPVGQLLERLSLCETSLARENNRIPVQTTAAFWEGAAALTEDDLFGFHFGQGFGSGPIGLIGFLATSQETVADLLRTLARYRRVHSDAIELDLSRLDSDGWLEWHYLVPASVRMVQLVEFNASNLTTAFRRASGREIRLRSVHFEHPRTVGTDAFQQFFGCKVTFGAGVNRLVFRMEDLALPLMTTNNELAGILRRYGREILERRPAPEPDLVATVEREVARRLASGKAGQERIAAALGMSTRTLSRRLAEEGTSFGQLVARLRETLARRYISESVMPITEIAFMLGYADAGSFSTAFKRWTGSTPRKFRAHAGEQAD